MDFNFALVLFAIVSTGTPGPNNMMIMTSGLNFGVQRSMPHWLGIITGVPVMLFMLGFGLDRLFQLYPFTFVAIKILGCSYLLYLAYKISQLKVDVDNISAKSKPMTYIQGLLFQWVNPKAWVMCIGAIAAFTVQDISMLPQIATIALTFMAVGFVCVGTWMSAGQLLQKLIKNERHQSFFNRTMAALLAISVIPMML